MGGGPMRSASLLEYLSRRYSVDAIFFRESGSPDPALSVPPGRIERLDVLELPRHSKTALARAARNSIRMVRNRPPLVDRFSGFEDAIQRLATREQYRVAVVEHFWCATYVDQLRPHSQRVILDLHNIESAWHGSLAQGEKGTRAMALRRFATACVALEREYLPKFDHLLVTSEDDARIAGAIAPDVASTVYPNALPEIPRPARREREEIVFSGNLEYAPNILAIRYFNQQIWPQLRERWPGLKWKIVGKHPEAIQSIIGGDTRIELTGFVEDAIAALAQSRVAVIPVLAGSGTRVKILEAWAAGTAVVSSTLGAEGLGCRNGEQLLIADDPSDFARAVSGLLDSAALREKIGAAGRRFFEDRFTWANAWRSLDALFAANLDGAI